MVGQNLAFNSFGKRWMMYVWSVLSLQGPRFTGGRPRGAALGGARGAPFGHAPRPLMGQPPGARPMIRHAAGKENESNSICCVFFATFAFFFFCSINCFFNQMIKLCFY